MLTLTPGPLFNPLTAPTPLPPIAVLAGPYGLLAFLPLVPLVRWLARWQPRAVLVLSGLVWLLATLRPLATGILLAWLAAAAGWVLLLGTLRRRGTLGERGMIAAVWIGLHALALPFWWQAQQSWYLPLSPLAALHQLGFAYYLFRFVAWGVNLAKQPDQPLRPLDTLCWILYPPCMRLGPVLLREQFLERLDGWNPRQAPPWRAIAGRLGWFALGAIGLGICMKQVPVPRAAGDFFTIPEQYATHLLWRAFYFIPIQVYLLLWTYNELAVALSLWVGLPVDNNFDRLPLATSVRDFWRRWHITVGKWLRDYIYIPLGGNRGRVALHTVLVFGYCGVWHGASWSFVAWGLLQAAALLVERAWDGFRARGGRTPPPPGRLRQAAGWLLTMHYQIATILVFTDFGHSGLRILPELLRRLIPAV